MNPASRRSFLTLAGATAVGAGVVAVLPAAEATAAPAPTKLPAGPSQPLLVHVDDARTGRLTVMLAGREVHLTDPDLAARLARVAATVNAV